MRTWCKRIGLLAGGLLGLGGLLSPAAAQDAAPTPTISLMSRLFGGGPPAPSSGPDFPNPAPGPTAPESPFTLKDGTPSAFNDLDCAPAPNIYRFTFRSEALSWWVGRVRVPGPLVTTAQNPNLTNNFGAVGQSGTEVLAGSPGPSYGPIYGGRFTIGMAPGFIPPLEVSGLFLNRTLDVFDGNGGAQLLARPVGLLTQSNLVNAPGQSVYLAGFPGVGTGNINIQSRFNLWAIDLDSFFNIADNGVVQIDVISGYKHADLRESLSIANTFASAGGLPFNGTTVPAGFSTGVVDQFSTLNQFDGGTLGFRTRIVNGSWMLMADTKLSFGNTRAASTLNGYSTLFGSGGSVTVPGGILVGASNSGTLVRNRFAVIPEANLNLSYQLTNNLRVFGGYSVLYWSNVARAGGQVHTSIDPRQVPTDVSFIPGFGGIGPAQHLTTSGFFANGVNVGLEIGF